MNFSFEYNAIICLLAAAATTMTSSWIYSIASSCSSIRTKSRIPCIFEECANEKYIVSISQKNGGYCSYRMDFLISRAINTLDSQKFSSDSHPHWIRSSYVKMNFFWSEIVDIFCSIVFYRFDANDSFAICLYEQNRINTSVLCAEMHAIIRN